ncbi:hypothetical protein V6N12_018981 [Hibiscus sabdariffa]|uniref:Helicase C-terminal domain-containing protein n=1 Tax=Hibiscus sabdariffa TaxID=183260 RepID=A0ABR2B9M1_9ROSI
MLVDLTGEEADKGMPEKTCVVSSFLFQIELSSKYCTVDTLKQQFCFLPAKLKECYLVYILTEMPGHTTMVFTRTCHATRLLNLILQNLNISSYPISGQMTQQKRKKALEEFESGKCRVLVCTDVASRGLDIPSVDMVINYDIPRNPKDYIHRVGRTARAGRSGFAISLVNQFEVQWYLQIEESIGKKLPEYKPNEKEVKLLMEMVKESRKQSLMKLKEIEGTKKRRGGDEDDEDIERYLGVKGKPSNARNIRHWEREFQLVDNILVRTQEEMDVVKGVHARLRWFGLILNEGETKLSFKDIEAWATSASDVSYISTTEIVSKIMELKADFTKLNS